MTTPRNLDGLIRTYLQEDQSPGKPEVPDHVYGAIRLGIERTRQRAVVGSFGMPHMHTFLAVGLGVAAVMLAGYIGVQLLGGPPPGGPAPVETTSPAESAASVGSWQEIPAAADLGVGPVEVIDYAGTSVDFRFTIPTEGWRGDSFFVAKGEGREWAALSFWPTGPYSVYADPCRWEGTEQHTTSAADIAGALAAQPGRNATVPTDVTISRYDGTLVELTVPADVVLADCDQAEYRSWGPDVRYHQGPGQIDRLWILEPHLLPNDPDEILLIVDISWFPETDPSWVTDMEAMVDSLWLEQ